MKTLTAFILSFLLLIQVSSISILRLCYEANQDYFTKNFCINKDKPDMKCNGKCHLDKTISKISNPVKSSAQIRVLHIAQDYINEVFTYSLTFVQSETISVSKDSFSYFFNFIVGIYKPPIR